MHCSSLISSEACLICQRAKGPEIHMESYPPFWLLYYFLSSHCSLFQHLSSTWTRGGIHSIFTKKTEGIDGKLQLVAYSSSLHRCKGTGRRIHMRIMKASQMKSPVHWTPSIFSSLQTIFLTSNILGTHHYLDFGIKPLIFLGKIILPHPHLLILKCVCVYVCVYIHIYIFHSLY